ncbi:RNA-binding cell elongation regulator Jag/EloR [Blautia sp. MSJ-19]|uniref:RNA-binding cell elongation regulator Jag/EloR n=2 Tax=unclassified Blautia TaxID=2648079 RepID=UPI001C0F224C|nr:RNA-binding cell elongation regulator Jag/EloR [Blautia sp. MSJ-19]MBU5482173.1 Jag N-terminal domain-containing protein [Blautia sp. MSJ-19]
MDEYMQFSAKTKSEAITKACIELGVSSDQLDIQVISEGSSGFFGIGSKPAIIKARKVENNFEENEIEKIVDSVKLDAFKEETVKETKKSAPKSVSRQNDVKPEIKTETAKASKEEKQPRPVKEKQFREKPAKEKPAREPKERPAKEKTVKASKPIEIITDPEEIKDIEERALVFLRDVFGSMDLGEVQITSKYNTTDGCLEVDFEGEDMGILIGKRGQTLDSLQYLTSLVVNKGKSDYIRVKLDTEDYRRRRKETLENLARGIAYKVKKTRKPVVLEPMNPYERRIIHSALQGNKFVETVSEGEEPYRHVVVKLKRY